MAQELATSDWTETVGSIRIATHSLKATVLAWSSKAGLSHDDRRLLGYHTSSSDASLLVYLRDAMAGPLRSLCQLIAQVVSGEFNPDATRSGLFIPRPDGVQISRAWDPKTKMTLMFLKKNKQWKMLRAGGSLMMSKRAALIFVIQARGAFTRPWMRLDRLVCPPSLWNVL